MLRARDLAAACAILCLWLTRASAGADVFAFGIGTHGVSDRGLELIRAAGISSLRDDIHWAEVEREKGVLIMPERYERYVDESLRHGIQPVLVLCYGNQFYDGGGYPLSHEAAEAYTRFAEFVVAHFKNRVRQYEIWNEWNIAIGLPPGTPRGRPEPYVALLRKVYPRLKAADPHSIVVGGVLSGSAVEKSWLEDACRAGLLEHLDGFSFHPYCFRQGSMARLPENGFVQQIRDSQEVTRRYQKREIPIYITEVGWPDHQGPDGSTPQDSARFLARTYLLTRTMPFIRSLWWYDFCDDGTDPHDREHHFGIVTRDFTPKPAYSAMSDIGHLFADAQFVSEIRSDPAIHILKFRSGTGKALFAMWSSQDASSHVIFETASTTSPTPVALREIGGGEIPAEWKAQASQWRIRVPLGGTPRVLETDVAGVEVTWQSVVP